MHVIFGEDHDPVTWIMMKDFATPEAIDSQNIGIGDEVVIVGAFFGHIGELRNIPIVRAGTIAAMPEEPVPTDCGFMEAYLVEARSISGLSGSPVLVHMGVRPPLKKPAPGDSMQTHYLIGLVHGHYSVQAPEEMVRTGLPAGDMNAGIAIVIPSARIIETLEQPKQQEYRKELWSTAYVVRAVPDGAQGS